MNKTWKAFTWLLAIVSNGHAQAYETQTHALITRKAYAQSSLASDGESSIRHRTGLNRLHPYTVFNAYWQEDAPAAYYLDGGGNGPATATDVPDIFEKCQMRAFLRIADIPRRPFKDLFADTVESNGYTEILPIQNWLVRGAIREDDMGDEIGWWTLPGTECDWEWFGTVYKQPGRITRSFRHFFDPYFDKGLSVAGIRYPRSVDWALGNYDSFADPLPVATGAA